MHDGVERSKSESGLQEAENPGDSSRPASFADRCSEDKLCRLIMIASCNEYRDDCHDNSSKRPEKGSCVDIRKRFDCEGVDAESNADPWKGAVAGIVSHDNSARHTTVSQILRGKGIFSSMQARKKGSDL